MPDQRLLVHTAVPRSLNRIATRGSRYAVRAEKKRWEEIFWACLLESHVPRNLLWVEARAELRFPTKHRRDSGNFGWILEKALGDSLSPHDRLAERWLPDDTDEFFRWRGTIIEAERGAPRTKIILDYQRISWI